MASKVRLVERLEGSAAAKERLTMLLEALAGWRTVAEACRSLGLGERRFHDLRGQALQAALASLEPRPAGRPAAGGEADPSVAALEAELRDLRLELRAAQVREEIALAMPQLLHRAAKPKKAGRRRPARPGPPAAAPEGCAPSVSPTPPAPGGAGPPGSG